MYSEPSQSSEIARKVMYRVTRSHDKLTIAAKNGFTVQEIILAASLPAKALPLLLALSPPSPPSPPSSHSYSNTNNP